MAQNPSAVIFCSVVDNFGDIGICWRLCRQLVAEHQWQVRLYVDDLDSFQRICPAVAPNMPVQLIAGVTVLQWHLAEAVKASELTGISLCVEALACTIPSGFLSTLAEASPEALWLNLEYLTAEDWAADCHGLPSPQRGLTLKKHFFFPGFTDRFGGLLREREVVAKASQLRQSAALQQQAWQQLSLPVPSVDTFKISVFAYSQRDFSHWLDVLSQQPNPVLLLVAEGALAASLRQQLPALTAGVLRQGQLELRILPFMPQQDYDVLLALCDVNFVRGEDSVIRAHWAGRPFIWQIYRQQEQAHLQKLQAFLDLMLAGAAPELADLYRRLHLAWEQEQGFAALWPQLLQHYPQLCALTLQWQQKLIQQQDLASNLVRFVKNHHIMSRNFS